MSIARSANCSARTTAIAAGRGGSMHIADFTVGHLGANAIVGGGVPIATGAAMANRYLGDAAMSSAASPATARTPTAWCWNR
jgi:TPP-dependent pyruvate/acetoin dehydrogenase alpha subunit